MTHFKSGWSDYLNPEKEKQYFIALDSYLQSKMNLNIYPPERLLVQSTRVFKL